MKKELPLNIAPKIRTYSYYAYPHSIISAKERIGEKAAKFIIKDFANYDWKISSPCLTRKGNQGEFEYISDNPYQCDLNGCIYRELKEDDYIQVFLEFQQYSLPWGAINLFITDEDNREMMDDEEYQCRFGYFNWQGLYLWNHGKECAVDRTNNRLPLYLLLHYKDNRIEAYAGKCETKLKRVGYFQWNRDDKHNYKIGIQIKLNDNAYYNWLYSNFIQISCDITNTDRRLDYYYGVQKDWKWNAVHYFLNHREIDICLLRKYGCLKYMKECINKGQYIELPVDQYYVKDREEYGYYHHYHSNLIYGYDDKKKIFLMEGYTNHGVLVKTEISYRDLNYILKKKDKISYVTVIEYRHDGYRYWCYEKYIVMMLREYLQGINSSYHLTNLVPQTERIYGVKVYQEFLSERGMEVFLKDKRISHLLYEHKVCMVERIRFMEYKKMICGDAAEQAIRKADSISRKMFNVRNLVVKNQITEQEETVGLIRTMLNEIEQEEVRMLKELLLTIHDADTGDEKEACS